MTRNTASPEQIERDIAETRAEIDITLDAIQDRLSPGRLLDRVLDYTKENGGAFAGNFGRSVRDNPLPVALLGIGLGWLMFAGGRPRQEHAGPHYDGSTEYDYPGDGDFGYVPKQEDSGQGIGQRVSDVAAAGGEKAKEWGDSARHMGDAASARMASARHRTAVTAGRLRDGAHRARESTGHFMEENPLVVGALAVAAGAALGALLPSTRREDELMGAEADRFRDVAGTEARAMAEAGKRAAESGEKPAMETPATTWREEGGDAPAAATPKTP